MGNLKVYTTLNKVWVKLLVLFENALKLNFENLEPSPRLHTHSDPIISKHTEQVKNYLWIYHGMH